MKYIDLFAGYGGFTLGIKQAYENYYRKFLRNKKISKNIQKNSTNIESGQDRTTCVGYSEIDKYAVQVYQKHFPSHKNYGDITKINISTIPDFDLLAAGFPCQAFSIAGKRRGFNDTRGTLFFSIAKILEAKRPKNFLLENVKGLLSHDNGRTFKIIIATLVELGYCVEWQVLNAKDFGVPQNRERVFVVGHFGRIPKQKIFPFGKTDSEIVKTKKLSKPISNCLRTNYSNRKSNETYIKQINNPIHSNDRIYSEDGISPTLNTMQGGNRQPFIAPVLSPDRKNKRQNGRRMKEDGDPSFTLTGQDRHGIYDGSKIRRLTPLECERLMGLPDRFTEFGIDKIGNKVKLSDSARYKLCGNGVVINCVEEIIKKIYLSTE